MMTKDELLLENKDLKQKITLLETQLTTVKNERDNEKKTREQIALKYSRTIQRIGGHITALHNLGDGLQDHLGSIK